MTRTIQVAVCIALLAAACSGGSGGGGSTGGTTGGTCATPLCGGTCCTGIQTCLYGSTCCDNAQICGVYCCDGNSVCVSDQAGYQACQHFCNGPGDCPASSPCCSLLFLPDGGVLSYGACIPASSTSAEACKCVTASDCTTLSDASCAPALNNLGYIMGPYLCVPNDSAGLGHGCTPGGSCAPTGVSECTTDSHGNHFCSQICTSDALCSNTGLACCDGTCGQNKCCGLCGN